MKHTAWSKEELEYVRDCRERPAPIPYSKIGAALGRSEKGCRAQYQYYFAPSRHAPKDSHYNTSDEMLPANITICWLCKHTNRFACPWFDPDNPRPVDGWTAEKESKLCVNTDNSRHYYVTYKVSHCPKFAPDDPKYYARWRERHKTKNVGECRSTK